MLASMRQWTVFGAGLIGCTACLTGRKVGTRCVLFAFVVSLAVQPHRARAVLGAESGTLAVIQTVHVGQHPLALRVDQRTRRVFVLNAGPFDYIGNSLGKASMSILDAATGTVRSTAPLPGYQTGLVMGFDGPDGPVDPDLLTVSERTNRVFILDYGADRGLTEHRRLFVLDATTGRVLRIVAVPAGPAAVLASEHDGRVFLLSANYGQPVLSILDARTGLVQHTVVLHPNVFGLVVDDDTGQIYVVSGHGAQSRISVVDAQGRIRRTFPTPSSICMSSVDGRAGRILVASSQANRHLSTVSVLDRTTGAVRGQVSVPGSYDCNGVVDEALGRAYIYGPPYYDGGTATMTTLDTHRGRLVNSVFVGPVFTDDAIGSAALDATRHRVYVDVVDGHSFGPETVVALDGRTGRMLSTLKLGAVGTGPAVVAVATATHRVFVLNAGNDTVSVLKAL